MGHFCKGAWVEDDYPDVTKRRMDEIKQLRWLIAGLPTSSERYGLVMSHIMYLYGMLPAKVKETYPWYMGEK